MEMSKEERAAYQGIMRRRYAGARRKKSRGLVLDEYCGMTGLSRKHAIKALSPKRGPAGRRGCPSGGTREGTALLVRLWRLSDMMCGKLLKAVLPEVLACARTLATGSDNRIAVARRCFEWVRDKIRHSRDSGLQPVTCTASDVLRIGSGYCYAKSHLLAALLRANGIPAGLCYQRLSRDGQGALWEHLPDIAL